MTGNAIRLYNQALQTKTADGKAWAMHKWRWRLAICAVWTFYALTFTTLQHYAARQAGRSFDWWHYFSWNLFGSYLWAILTPLVVGFSRRFPLESPRLIRNLLLHLPFVALFLVVQNLLFVVPRWFLDPSILEYHQSLVSLYRGQFMYSLGLDIVTYAAVLIGAQSFDYYRRYKEGEVRAAELKAQLARAELHALKMQLNPHFLFNTLNAVAELIHKDPERADEMITLLSDMLRASLDETGMQEVTLKRELDFLGKYLAIERTRMGDRLHIETHIAADVLDARVPNMLLQPLVENAVRHGIAPQAAGGSIRIEALRDGDTLRLHVSDTGRGIVKPREDAPIREADAARVGAIIKGNENHLSGVDTTSGVGIANTRARLTHLYGGAHRFELHPAKPHGLTVCIQIPFREDDCGDDPTHTDARH